MDRLQERAVGQGGVVTSALPAEKLGRVLSLIDERLCESLKLRELAGCVEMSQFHFARKFRASTGQSPHAFLTEQRMARARQLLRDTDLPLAEVATRVGYQTQAHFTGVFRRYVGVTPRVYRFQPTEATAGPGEAEPVFHRVPAAAAVEQREIA